MKSVKFLGIALVLLQSVSFAQSEPVVEGEVPVPYRGVDQRVKLDKWTRGLLTGKPTDGAKQPEANKLQSIIVRTYRDTIQNGYDVDKFFEKLVKLYAVDFGSAGFDVYAMLADQIFKARDQLRLNLDQSSLKSQWQKLIKKPELSEMTLDELKERVQQVVVLLQIMAEEVLYVGTMKLKDKAPAEVRYSNPSWDQVKLQKGEEQYYFLGGKNDLNGITKSIRLFEGDVILSKGSSGSSSFLARVSKYPGGFSHSTTSTIRDGSLRFPEAFIEDGVLLRDPQKSYVENRKKKLFVYRYRGESPFQQKNEFRSEVKSSVTNFLHTMTKNSGGKPEINASFGYDFEMDPGSTEKMFCSEVVYHIYDSAYGSQDLRNPYAEEVWSKTEGMTKEFFDKFLGITIDSYPAPSDVEANSQYGLVGYSMVLSEMRKVKNAETGAESEVKVNLSAEERVDTALIDTLLYTMQVNESVVDQYLDQVKDIGNEPVTDEQIAAVVAQLKAKKGIDVPPATLEALKHRPQGISAKQLLFFSYLNDVMTPSIRASVDPTKEVGPLKLRSDMLVLVQKHLVELGDVAVELALEAKKNKNAKK